MANRPMTVRVSAELHASLEGIARHQSRNLSSIAAEMLEEGIRMRRIPGILFADGPTGRRARIAGTGIEVFEAIDTYLAVERNWDRLRNSYPHLQEHQLRAALAYYELYPTDVERFLEPQDGSLDEMYRQHSFMRTGSRDDPQDS